MPSNRYDLDADAHAKLDRLLQWYERHKRLAWKPLVANRDGPLAASKFSGKPWLAEDEAWPLCANCGQQLPLFLQLNLGELPEELGHRFGRGLLQMFYCPNFELECDRESYRPFAGNKIVRIVRPMGRGRQVQLPKFSGYPLHEAYFPVKRIIGWRKLDDYPDGMELDELGLETEYDWAASKVTLRCKELGLVLERVDMEITDEFNRCVRRDKLAGWPDWLQGVEYPSCPRCGRKMQLVFQLDSEDNLPLMFGDGGRGHITQCPVHKKVLAFGWACC